MFHVKHFYTKKHKNINMYKNIHHFLQMGLMNQRNNIKRKTENALILLLILMIKAMILLILTMFTKTALSKDPVQDTAELSLCR